MDSGGRRTSAQAEDLTASRLNIERGSRTQGKRKAGEGRSHDKGELKESAAGRP